MKLEDNKIKQNIKKQHKNTEGSFPEGLFMFVVLHPETVTETRGSKVPQSAILIFFFIRCRSISISVTPKIHNLVFTLRERERERERALTLGS